MTFKTDFDAIIDKKVIKAMKRINSPSEMKKTGKFASNVIRVRTRLGKGVNSDGGAETALKPLEQSTRDQRAVGKSGRTKIRKNPTSLPRLSNKTSPNKSNLTWTGQLLDDIKTIVSNTGRVVIGFATSRSRKIASYHQVEGAGKTRVKRPFFFLSAKDKSKIANDLRRRFRSFLRKT